MTKRCEDRLHLGAGMHVNVVPPAESPNLSYRFVNYAELGKSVFLSDVRRKQTVRNAEGSADMGM